jgi:hypothetical protein
VVPAYEKVAPLACHLENLSLIPPLGTDLSLWLVKGNGMTLGDVTLSQGCHR